MQGRVGYGIPWEGSSPGTWHWIQAPFPGILGTTTPGRSKQPHWGCCSITQSKNKSFPCLRLVQQQSKTCAGYKGGKLACIPVQVRIALLNKYDESIFQFSSELTISKSLTITQCVFSTLCCGKATPVFLIPLITVFSNCKRLSLENLIVSHKIL